VVRGVTPLFPPNDGGITQKTALEGIDPRDLYQEDDTRRLKKTRQVLPRCGTVARPRGRDPNAKGLCGMQNLHVHKEFRGSNGQEIFFPFCGEHSEGGMEFGDLGAKL